MSAQVRGWCPTVFAPMQTGDGFLARVKPVHASLSLAGARSLAAAAREHGNGMLNLTNRGNLQVRGLSEASAGAFAAAMVTAGLADPDAEVERRRNVIVSPLVGDDPDVAPTTRAVADAIARVLASDPTRAGLPEKFAVAVDGGGALPLGETGARVHIRLGDPLPAGAGTPVGYIPYRSEARGAFGFAPPFGQMPSDALLALAAIAERAGAATLRVTPWRALMIPGVPASASAELSEAGTAAGFIVEGTDPRLRIVACPGKPACAEASVDTLRDAETLAGRVPGAALVHVAGCTKGCAHPRAAAVTFVGIDGRYGIVRDGSAVDPPSEWAA
jgi:precorrin-3B synthase